MTAPHPIILLYVSRNVRINLENLTKRCFKSCKIMMRVKMRIVMQRNQSISIYLLSVCTLSISNSASPVTSMTEDTATVWAGTQDRCCLSIHLAPPRLINARLLQPENVFLHFCGRGLPVSAGLVAGRGKVH